MQQSQWEAIILKPTAVFLSFLSAQLPQVDLPDLKLLQTDNTAYLIRKQASDEETLNEIELHFATMFRHEICRWLGKDARNEIEGSFLDFLCCFKFELHSHIVLLENSFEEAQQLVRIKPRSILLKWIKSVAQEDSELIDVLDKVNLADLAENATVIVKNFCQLSEVKTFLRQYFPIIYEAEMLRMCERGEQWPYVDSYESFCRYFAVDIHTQMVHLH
jgi:hypothetical protein